MHIEPFEPTNIYRVKIAGNSIVFKYAKRLEDHKPKNGDIYATYLSHKALFGPDDTKEFFRYTDGKLVPFTTQESDILKQAVATLEEYYV